MRGVQSVADENAIADGPVLVPNLRKPTPDGIVGDQRGATERALEHVLAFGSGGFRAHRLESTAVERGLVNLDDEGAHVGCMRMVMRVEGPVRSCDESMAEPFEPALCAVPRVAVRQVLHG